MFRFNVFGLRDKPLPDVFVYDKLSDRLRGQIVHLWGDSLYEVERWDCGRKHYPLLIEIRQMICRAHGLPYLSEHGVSADQDCVGMLMSEQDVKLVLGLIEASFRVIAGYDHYWTYWKMPPGQLVEELNFCFRMNGVGYEFDSNALMIVRVDQTAAHAEIIKPALALLTDRRFKTANKELLEAFDEYKIGKYGDCLTKCCASFESVLKVVCHHRRWPYDPDKDTCGALVPKVISGAGLPSSFAEPLKMIGMFRNKLSTAHGGGVKERNAVDHHARYALHSTTAAILLIAPLVDP